MRTWFSGRGTLLKKIWAFEPEFAREYQQRIENVTPQEIEAAERMYGGKETPSIYSKDGDIANISITGPLSRKGPSIVDMLFGFGGTSYAKIVESIRLAEEDFSIKEINLQEDTPGGEVTGVDEVYKVIAKCKKKITAINRGMIASAGYWIASACDKIVASEETSRTGSIGVVITAVDYSKFYEDHGVKVVEIVSKNAPNKRPDIKTKRGRDVLQEQADKIEEIFIARVAKGRKKTPETVISDFGKGGMMLVKDAMSAGMVDGMAYENEPLEDDDGGDESTDVTSYEDNPSVNAEDNTTPTAEEPEKGEHMEETMQTLSEFLASNPDAKAKYDADIAAARGEGVEVGKKENQKRVDVAAKYLESEEYRSKATIQTLACKVLKGESEPSALEGAVTAFDMLKEQSASETAQAETTNQGETNAEEHQVNTSGLISSEADIVALKHDEGGK